VLCRSDVTHTNGPPTNPGHFTIAAGWYVGVGSGASSERWAFAFSAKKDWVQKLRDDVAKIAHTQRGYTKAFFISSQYVPDRQRASEEDSLRKEYSLDVRILDRTWILDRVFAGRHENVAIEKLAIAVSTIREIRKGPLDLQRERDLEELEQRIRGAASHGPRLPFVDDCLEAALLVRSLELPRTDVEGRFARAENAAKDHGTQHQAVLAFYGHAWTMFWWFDDFKAFLQLYEEVEALALDSANAADLELLANLWALLIAAERHKHLSPEEARCTERASKLDKSLAELAKDQQRPSSALQARASRAHMSLVASAPTPPDTVLSELKAIVDASEGLVGFRLSGISDLIIEPSEYFVGHRAYETLFEAVVTTTAKRKGEVAAARLLLKRGAEHLDADRPYEAIRTLGRALRYLYKHESRHDVVRALYLCASAYERVGLLWAARGTLLHAASISANEWWTHSDVNMALATCCNRLKWVELQLGRVPHLLAWHQIDRGTRAQLAVQGYRADQLAAGEMDFDGILGILLLRSDVWQLKALEMLPDALDAMGLHAASLALTFALGDIDGIRADVRAKDDHEVEQPFKALSTQPAGRDLPEEPSLVSAQTLHLASIVLGCRIEVTTSNAPPCVELAESLLAALESLLSTSVLEGVAPRVPSIDIVVRRSDFGEFPFRFDAKDVGGLPSVEIRCASFAPHTLPVSEQRQLREAMFELVAHLLGRTFFFTEREELGRIFLDEQGMHRALDFTASFGPIANVLGNTPRTRLEDWTEAKNRRFPLTRIIHDDR
jgi:tetratricopeptide (TPR) repeat protein